MLRYWHEKAAFGDRESKLWQNLRLIDISRNGEAIPGEPLGCLQ